MRFFDLRMYGDDEDSSRARLKTIASGKQGTLTSLTGHRNAKLVATGTYRGVVKLWDLEGNELDSS